MDLLLSLGLLFGIVGILLMLSGDYLYEIIGFCSVIVFVLLDILLIINNLGV